MYKNSRRKTLLSISFKLDEQCKMKNKSQRKGQAGKEETLSEKPVNTQHPPGETGQDYHYIKTPLKILLLSRSG